jgi:hypothetical protein
MADSEAFTPEGEANSNFRPRPSELLVENLRHLAHILASTWDGRENFLTIYVVLPQHIVAASIFVEQRLEHVVVVVAREVINLLAALQAKLGAPKWLFHIKLDKGGYLGRSALVTLVAVGHSDCCCWGKRGYGSGFARV